MIKVNKEKSIKKQIQEAKQFLASTDYKMTSDYDKDTTELLLKRQEAREFIRSHE